MRCIVEAFARTARPTGVQAYGSCFESRVTNEEQEMRKGLFTTRAFRAVMLVLGLVLLSTLAYGQETANIIGTVTDPSGAAVPNAKVTITNTDTGIIRSTSTNSTGNYAARELSFGHYIVRVESAGFKVSERTGITLNVNDTARADVSLQVGESKESVTVEANAIEVQADTNEVSQTITQSQVADLATNGPQRDSTGGFGARRIVQYSGLRYPHGADSKPFHPV